MAIGCEKGIILACVKLGEKMAEKDLLKALMLFRFACDRGEDDACKKTERYRAQYQKLRKDMERACRDGDGLACDLAKKERAKMRETFKMACDLGDEKACERFVKISNNPR